VAVERCAPGEALVRLQTLLAPRSVAVLGATPREGSYGRTNVETIVGSGFKGPVYPINPKYDAVIGLRCYPDFAALPERPDLAVVVVANALVDEALDAVIAAGVPAATLFASGYLEGDGTPPLTERTRAKARAAGLRLLGGNCLGFQNREHPLTVGVFAVPDVEPGPIAMVSHSGSAYLSISTLDPRFMPNLIVSAGQELALTAADYAAYALDRPSTRVIGLFLETVRDPASFRTVLRRANEQDVPVVALKVGRTERSARLARTHSGALTGNDAAYQALFDHYGVRRVESVDELTATCLLLSAPRRYVQGALGAVLDSGGQRGMMVDLASRMGVPIAEISPTTTAKLADVLEYGLDPVNPVDAWGTGRDAGRTFGTCFRALADDPGVGMVALFSDVSIDDSVTRAFIGNMVDAAPATAKPMMIVLNWSRCFGPKAHVDAIKAGVPILDGVETGLRAMAHAMGYATYRGRTAVAPTPAPDAAVVTRWRARLAAGTTLAEHESLALLADFGVPTVPFRKVGDEKGAVDAAAGLGFPVALKTAAGIAHKTEAKGVHLGLADAGAVRGAYADLAARLGPDALVMPMAAPGVEMALGVVMDEQFGPLVMIGAGGVLVETLEDRAYLLAGADGARARAAIERLHVRKVLAGVRGRPLADVAALAQAAARLGAMALALGETLAEVDANPIIVTANGALAVDALVVPAAKG